MNNVSWFLYLIDLFYSLSNNFLGPMAVISIIASMIIIIITNLYKTHTEHDSQSGYTRTKVFLAPHLKRHLSYLIPTAIISLLIISIIPSKQTMYMIAASQIGEQVVQLEEVQAIGGDVGGLASDAIKLLRERISTELATEAD